MVDTNGDKSERKWLLNALGRRSDIFVLILCVFYALFWVINLVKKVGKNKLDYDIII